MKSYFGSIVADICFGLMTVVMISILVGASIHADSTTQAKEAEVKKRIRQLENEVFELRIRLQEKEKAEKDDS